MGPSKPSRRIDAEERLANLMAKEAGMATFTIHEAKTQLSKLIARAEAGEEIVIARGKQPVVKLEALKPAKRKLTFGALAGKYPDIPDAFFFDPLPEDELKLWEGDTGDPAG